MGKIKSLFKRLFSKENLENDVYRDFGIFLGLLLFEAIPRQFFKIITENIFNISIGPFILMGIIGIYVLFLIHKYWSYKIIIPLLVYGSFFVSIFFLFYLLFPLNRTFMLAEAKNYFYAAIVGTCFLSLFPYIKDIKRCFVEIRKVLLVVCCIVPITYFAGGNTRLSPMSWGSSTFRAAIIYVFINLSFLKGEVKTRFYHWIAMAMIIVFNLFGGRQSLVFFIAALLLILLMRKAPIKQKIIIFSSVFACCFLFFVFNQQIRDGLAYVLEKFNISSRSLKKISTGQLFSFYNREEVYTNVFDIIGKTWYKISGIFSDRYYLSQYEKVFAYAHNLFFELIIDFGAILGSIFSLMYVAFFVIGLILTKKEYKLFYLIFMIIGVARFMISGSFLVESGLFYAIGITINKNIVDWNKIPLFAKIAAKQQNNAQENN